MRGYGNLAFFVLKNGHADFPHACAGVTGLSAGSVCLSSIGDKDLKFGLFGLPIVGKLFYYSLSSLSSKIRAPDSGSKFVFPGIALNFQNMANKIIEELERRSNLRVVFLH